MSQERIVNRVSQPNQAQDGAPQSVEQKRVVAVEVIEPMGEFPNYELAGDPAEATPRDVIDQIVEQAAKDLNWSSCVVCNPSTNSAINQYCEAHKAGLVEAGRAFPLIEELLQNRSTLTRDPDLAAFKKQVIAAFKHFGLDTRQFFGV